MDNNKIDDNNSGCFRSMLNGIGNFFGGIIEAAKGLFGEKPESKVGNSSIGERKAAPDVDVSATIDNEIKRVKKGKNSTPKKEYIKKLKEYKKEIDTPVPTNDHLDEEAAKQATQKDMHNATVMRNNARIELMYAMFEYNNTANPDDNDFEKFKNLKEILDDSETLTEAREQTKKDLEKLVAKSATLAQKEILEIEDEIPETEEPVYSNAPADGAGSQEEIFESEDLWNWEKELSSTEPEITKANLGEVDSSQKKIPVSINDGLGKWVVDLSKSEEKTKGELKKEIFYKEMDENKRNERLLNWEKELSSTEPEITKANLGEVDSSQKKIPVSINDGLGKWVADLSKSEEKTKGELKKEIFYKEMGENK